MYRIPARATAGGGPPISIPAREFTAKADGKLDRGVYKVSWHIAGPSAVPVRVELTAASKLDEMAETLADRIPEMLFVADPSAPPS